MEHIRHKIWLIAASLILCISNIGADSAYPDSIAITQPDGSTLWTMLHGDEFYHWRSTTDGYVIVSNEQKAMVYAQVQGDTLAPTNIMVNNVQSRNLKEKIFIAQQGKIVQQWLAMDKKRILTNDSTIARMRVQRAANSSKTCVGKRKVLTILMDFKDRPFTYSASDFDAMMNQKGYSGCGSKGSVRDFYLENSYGKLDVSAVVVGPFRANLKSSRYAWNKGDNDMWTRELVREAIYAAIGSGIKLTDFDGNRDGEVDAIHVVFAGHGLSDGAPDGLIWPHKFQITAPIVRDKVAASTYIITPELYYNKENKEEKIIAPIGTICHELGHVFGAWDFYDTDDEQGGTYYATGKYDLMCNGEWNNNGRCPAHHNPYVKSYVYGWLSPYEMGAQTKSYTMLPIKQIPLVYRVNTSTPNEFFLLENRVRSGFDSYIPNGGLVIYHIHKNMSTDIRNFNNAHPLYCYAVNAWANSNPTDNPQSYGYRDTKRAFPSDDGRKMFFTATSTPSFTAWDGTPTGVNLCFIRKVGDNIAFTVNPQIAGSNMLCNEEEYCIDGAVPATANIAWSYSSPIKAVPALPVLRISNTKVSCPTVERGFEFVNPIDPGVDTATTQLPGGEIIMAAAAPPRFYKQPYVGEATLRATVSSRGDQYTITKKLTLPANIRPSLGNDANPIMRPIWTVGQEFSFTEKNCGSLPAEQIKWYVRYPKATADVVYTGRTVRLKPTQEGELTIRIVNECGCETKNEVSYTFAITQMATQLTYPNPAFGSTLDVTIIDNTTTNDTAPMSRTRSTTAGQVYTLELWSATLGRVRSVNTSATTVSIDIVGLPEGWYQLLLKQDGEILSAGNVKINP